MNDFQPPPCPAPPVHMVYSAHEVEGRRKALKLAEGDYIYVPNNWVLHVICVDPRVTYFVHHNVSHSRTVSKFGTAPLDPRNVNSPAIL